MYPVQVSLPDRAKKYGRLIDFYKILGWGGAGGWQFLFPAVRAQVTLITTKKPGLQYTEAYRLN
jgi:hypothetical protein